MALGFAVWEQVAELQWDVAKREVNERKHGGSFVEASTVFGDPLELTHL